MMDAHDGAHGARSFVLQVLRMMDVPFETVNILESDELRNGMKEFSQWPTFPQVRMMITLCCS